ncbi:MAG: asparagine synthase (glutamine-hydrolyzing) [Pseudomonadota bacterium]
MCGFAGVLKANLSVDEEALSRMVTALKHRGPDGQGLWIEDNFGLAHARLSILDVSTAGHQPMFSISKRFIIAFNGEIYNYKELKKELIQQFNCVFVTQSDTEMLINAIELWGIEKTLEKCTGMFAFAAWNRKEKLLYLARDRFGEKPLYYGKIGVDFVFASELKSIYAVYKDRMHIDRDVLATYMRYSYVPTPYSIYGEIKKLEPGTYLTINPKLDIQKRTYWSAINIALQGKANPLVMSFNEASNQLENQLKKTLRGQMLSDVPLGAFLSGGVDSSIVVALMQSLSNNPIKTFSIGFKEKKYDESVFARAVAKHIGTDHTELFVTDQDAMAVIPKLAHIYDEPFADSSQIPTFLVSQLARKKVAVSLSGDGGDEVFGGYNRYLHGLRVKNILGNPLINFCLKHYPMQWLSWLDYFRQKKISGFSEKIKKMQQMADLLKGSFANVYYGFCTMAYSKNSLILQSTEIPLLDQVKYSSLLASFSEMEWMMLVDTLTYLTDDIMVKVDRAAMAVSLETRAPLLDHRIFELAWRLPENYKVKSGQGKCVLREVLYRYVPKTLIERPKMGFGIPYAQWLRGGLAGWMQEVLNSDQLHRQGYLNVPLIQKYLAEHLSGKRDWQGILWNILMFQSWLENWNNSN